MIAIVVKLAQFQTSNMDSILCLFNSVFVSIPNDSLFHDVVNMHTKLYFRGSKIV